MSPKKEIINIAASVRDRLGKIAIERFLYRLSLSPHVDKFVLKGAQLFRLWTDLPYRSTRDLDLLGVGGQGYDKLAEEFRGICLQPVEARDGIEFQPDSIYWEEIREQNEYHGVRLKIGYSLGSIRDRMQIDVGIGDSVFPQPEMVDFGSMLCLPSPRVLAYLKETVVAEKFHAMVHLGMANSRMKDFFDLCVMASEFRFDGRTLKETIQNTFTRRGLQLPEKPPLALTEAFAKDKLKQVQWDGFLKKSGLRVEQTDLQVIVNLLENFLMPPSVALARGESFDLSWLPGGPWE
jgi:hypothetical protein